MNERIRELAEQARIKDHWSIDEGRYLTNYLNEQKFAELIVKECIVDYYRRYLDICSDEDITVQVERYVKEYFGVEE